MSWFSRLTRATPPERARQKRDDPRAACLLAGGSVSNEASSDELTFEVSAMDGDSQWGIVQSPFMQDNARTIEYRHKTKLGGDRLSYSQTTIVDIYGKRFEHTDENQLTHC